MRAQFFYIVGHHGVHPGRLTCSVGVAVAEDGYSDLKALLDAADQALYRAKASGRNRVESSPHRAKRRPMIKRRLIR
jgi:diguanylate cyclase (GGDEF)-like protein